MDQITALSSVKSLIIESDRAEALHFQHLRIISVSRAAAEFLEYEEQELLGSDLDKLYPIDKTREVWLLAFSRLQADNNIEFDGQIRKKTKTVIPVSVSLISLAFEEAKSHRILILLNEQNQASDLAVRESGGELGSIQCREVEYALVESEERFRQMADMAGEWLWEQDPGGYYIYSSMAVKQILGFTQQEVIGKHYTEFLTASDKADQQYYSQIRQPFYGLSNHYQHKDGHLVITESTGLPIIDAEGKLLKWRGVDRDITAKKQYQDALIESEKHIRLIIESSLSAIIIMDSYGIITDWNSQAEKIFGWTRDQAVGQRLDQMIIPERMRTAHRLGMQHFLNTGEGPILNRLIEQTAMRRDQTEFPVELSISPMKVGNAYSFSSFIHDISSRKAAEREIRQGQVKLAIARNEINIARQIQASLSPSEPIITEQFEVTGYCLPADQVGGDYFDYFYSNGDRLEMIIADVSGHSIGPALFMVETRSAIRAQVNGMETPAEKLNLLNRFLFEDLDKSDFFITLFYLQYDIRNRQLCFSNAGHPTPLLFRQAHKDCIQLDAEGLILGVDKNVKFEEDSIKLFPGDVLLLYTDGLTEAENGEGDFFGIERVTEILNESAGQQPKVIIDALLSRLKQFCRTESFNDDITLMVFQCR